MKMLVRADAGPGIGAGHMMRCLALAQAAKKKGAEVTFVAVHSPAAIDKKIRASRLGLLRLTCGIGSAEDAKKTLECARRLGADLLVLDGYGFGAGYRKTLKASGLKLLAIDDRIHAGRNALLRKEFHERGSRPKKIAPVAKKVLVTMGGGDSDDVSFKALKTLTGLTGRKLDVTVVAGPDYSGGEKLKGLAWGAGLKMTLKKNPADMAALMERTDVAISAAGSTSWELAFMGVPSLLVVLADNQWPVAREMQRKKAAVSLGWHGRLREARIARALKRLLDSPAERKKMSRAGQRLVDGRGAERALARIGA